MGDRVGESIGGIVVMVFFILGGVWIYNNWTNPPHKWSLIYINDYDIAVSAGEYRSRDECAHKLRLAIDRDYDSPECGLNCRPPETAMGLYVCKETFSL
jgi:hypothetical protein